MSSRWTWACALGCAASTGLASVLAADGDVAENSPADANPYSVISDRNIFHLNPPPPPHSPDEDKPPELSKVMLTGIMKKHDSIEVFLAIPPKDNKETTLYLSLALGETLHGVQLQRVRYDKGEVDIVNEGTPETLSVKSNSYASMSVAPAAGHGDRGGAPGLPGFGHKAGFGPMRNTLPTPPGPTAAAAPRGGSAIIAGGGGGSAIISGGGGYGNGNAPIGGGGTIVSGGSPYGVGAQANTAGEQISSALMNQHPNSVVQPALVTPALPVDVQAAQLMVHEAAGGPPMPPMPGEK